MSKKVRNRIIFVCICILIILGIFEIGKWTMHSVFDNKSQVTESKSKNKTKKTSALDKRIQAYMKKHPKLSKKEATKRVKMNLDYQPYTHTKTVEDLNSLTMLVNKYNKLPSDYEPKDLVEVTNSGENDAKMRKTAAKHFEEMVNAASSNNIQLSACSAYRSYAYQKNLYDTGVENYGKEYADAYWTRPGFSEHQTGLSVDIRLDGNTSDLDAPRNSENYPWLLKHMHEYGFIVRYPEKKKQYTLIEPESWHLRYVGKKLATYLYKNNLTLDEYYGSKN